jgi:hypothetical protein
MRLSLSPRAHFFRWTFGLLAALSFGVTQANAATDTRYGLVGTGGKAFAEKLELTWYALEGNYTNTGVFSSTNPANDPTGGRKVLRKVAKLNVRADNLGQSNLQFQTALLVYANTLAVWFSNPAGAKPTFTWYDPVATSLSAAESLQIVTTITREKTLSPAVSGTVWEIGNEPNLFPAILPASYGAIFNRYSKIIKQADPTARVALGPLFVRETAMDLLPRMREILSQNLTSSGFGNPGQALFDSVNNNVWAAYSSRTLNLGTVEYLGQVLAALDTSVHPEIGSLHVYPFDDRLPTLTTAAVKKTLDSLADSLTTRLQKKNPAAVLWITEFGNLNEGLTEDASAAQASSLLDVFTANAKFQNWFYYKATGYDTQLLGLPGLSAPLTRLASDTAFNPADGDFACTRLNAIGRMYYQRANGTACTDAQTGFQSTQSLANPFNLANVPLPLRLRPASKDTVRVEVAVVGGSLIENTHFTLPSHTVTFAPGDSSASGTIHFLATQSGTIQLRLRNASRAVVSADSAHSVTVQPIDAVLSGALPGGLSLSLDPAGPSLIVVTPERIALRTRILDAAGKMRGTRLQSLETGRHVLDLRDRMGSDMAAGHYSLEVSGQGFRRIFPFPRTTFQGPRD